MEQLIALIDKFKEGKASTQEKNRLLAALSLNEPALKAWLENKYEKTVADQTTILSKERSNEILLLIQKRKAADASLQQKTTTRIIHLNGNRWRWLSAACIVLVMGLGVWFLNKTRYNSPSLATIKVKQQLQQYRNVTTRPVIIHLQDGSIVTVEPKSAIAYYQPFTTTRTVSLVGKATFTVAKHPAQPFTVYANGIATTALGTAFIIDALSNSIRVKLLEGKVVVRSVSKTIALSDTYLKPGEQLYRDKQSGAYAVSKFHLPVDEKTTLAANKSEGSSQRNRPRTTALTFNKTPLEQVFKEVGQKYNVQLQYNTKEILGLSFTGIFLTTDSLQSILNIICNTNDLSFKLDKSNIVISR